MIFTTKGRMAVPNRMSFKKWSKFMLPFFETLNRALWSSNWYKMVNMSRNDLDQLLLWMVPTANYGQLIQIIIPTQKYDKLFHYMVQTVLLFNGLVELSILNLGNPTPIAKYGSSPSLCGPINNWRQDLSANSLLVIELSQHLNPDNILLIGLVELFILVIQLL